MRRTKFNDGMGENLQFLIIEVRKQLEKSSKYFQRPSKRLLEKMEARDDYIDNLKSIIQKKSYRQAGRRDGKTINLSLVRAVDTVASNLELIADKCLNIVRQVGYIKQKKVLFQLNQIFQPSFETILDGINLIEDAVFENNVQIALEICRCEIRSDKLHRQNFEKILEALRNGENPQSQVTLLLISNYFERMGDALLNIGEAVLSAAIGQRIKVDQFQAFNSNLDYVNMDEDGLELEQMGETNSGCRINRVSSLGGHSGRRIAIFKEGNEKKLREEKEGIERWEKIFPGLAPKIYSYHKEGGIGSIMVEHINGHTFKDLLIHQGFKQVKRSLGAICNVVETVWESTLTTQPAQANFMQQLEKRLPDVYAVHPEFKDENLTLGSTQVRSFENLMHELREREEKDGTNGLGSAPFSVFIHGDFNIDNLIWEPASNKVKYIDLHRSNDTDFVQDVSVFLISNYRLQVFRAPVRQKIRDSIATFQDFANQYAQKHKDKYFNYRLGLGVARSFATSTRFILDKGFARSMMLRSRYLMEQLLISKQPENFRLPQEVFFD